MTPNYPLVTIITPAYNRASFLSETIESVLTQKYPNIEYIVLDDGSTDNTQEVLEKYNGHIKWESHSNMGETQTVNKGLKMATGEIVCIVNSDDPLLPNAIVTGVKALLENPDTLAAYPDWDEIGPHSELIQHHKLQNYNIQNMLIDFCVLIGPGVFIRRSTIEQFGMRDTQFKYVGDLEYWFRLASQGKLFHIEKPLATHRVHPGGASFTDQGARMADELVLMVEKTLNLQNIDSSILHLRNRALSQSHYVAMFYCGKDRRAKFRHFVFSFIYNPYFYINFLWIFVKRAWFFVKIFLSKVLKFSN